ncbi:M23 family metallopeptidase [Streptomyces paromomycinus]|uniref:M23 family metallopeptidase n=1 Tax=Streptomyces paromomycinus TaxID=92743 RepID=UPI001478E03E|nr:M23 family metallopeptidase [Streptomyces paromomycinus]
MTLSLVVALTAAAGTEPAAGGTARAGTPAAASAPAEPSDNAPLPSLPARRRPSPARAHGADRLAAASLEALRLGRAAHRTGRSYAKILREVRAGRARASRLQAALLRERRRAGELRRAAGRIAGAQYRSNNRLPFALSGRVRHASQARHGHQAHHGPRPHHGPQARLGPDAVLDAYRDADHRQHLLASRAREALRLSRALEADSAAVLARSAALDAHRSRLDTERRRISRRLGVVRGQLRELSRKASREGHCGLPGTVSAAAKRSEPAAPPVTAPGVRWTRPVEHYVLSAGFGGSGRRWAHVHTGQDFAVPVGTPVRSVGWGRVTSLTCGDGFGISMVVQHGAGVFSQYAHLSAALARPGQRVRPGQQIALSGTTGNSTGPHLHFEVRRTPRMGSGVDPVPWLASRGVRLR